MRKLFIVLSVLLCVAVLCAKQTLWQKQHQIGIQKVEKMLQNKAVWNKRNPDVIEIYRNKKHITTLQIKEGKLELIKGALVNGQYLSGQQFFKEIIALTKGASTKKQLEKMQPKIRVLLSNKPPFAVEVEVTSSQITIRFIKNEHPRALHVKGVFKNNQLMGIKAAVEPYGSEINIEVMEKHDLIETVKMVFDI